jgi:hypothetical protein
VRLYTSNGVRSLKQSAAIGLPLSFIFFTLLTLTLLAISGASLPAVARASQGVWFIANQEADGVWLLGLAGIIVFAAAIYRWPPRRRAAFVAARRQGIMFLVLTIMWCTRCCRSRLSSRP